MKQLLTILFLFASIISYSQTIDGFCDLKFGAEQKDVLELSWVKDSIVEQKEGRNDLDVFVKNVRYNDKVYNVCLLRFYRGELYSGLVAKFSESKEMLLQEVDSLKNSIGIEPLDFKNHENNELDRVVFRDSNQNELFVEAINERDLYVLRLHYYSATLTAKKKKEYDERSAKNTIYGGLKSIDR